MFARIFRADYKERNFFMMGYFCKFRILQNTPDLISNFNDFVREVLIVLTNNYFQESPREPGTRALGRVPQILDRELDP